MIVRQMEDMIGKLSAVGNIDGKGDALEVGGQDVDTRLGCTEQGPVYWPVAGGLQSAKP
jgi:hypothetical protein